MRRFLRYLPLLLPSLATGGVIHVDASAPPGGDGSSPAQAFQDLQQALAIVQAKDVIHIAEGSYLPSQSANPADSFVIPNFVTVVGGFKAGLTDGTPDPDSYPTILSGDLGKDDSDPNGNGIIASSDDQIGTNSHHVLTIAGAGDGVKLIGLVITAGNADGAPNNHGGGLLATGSELQIENCWFRGNQGGGRGGALHLDDCEARIVNCDFAGNLSVARGGAVGTVNGTDAEFINCLIRGNESARGGGLNFNGSTGLLLNCTVSGNRATINGGGIQSHSSAVTVTDSILWWNAVGTPGSRSNLGASYNELSGGTVTPSASSIVENESGSDPDFISGFDPANTPDTAGNHRLSRGSPAINAGSSSANGTSTDYDGNPRVVGSAIDLGAFEATPSDIFVDETATGANDGSSWADAHNTLQPALAAALPGDRILIAEGVYTPATATDSFEIPADVEIYGGYPDGGGTRDPDTHLTILSGDVGGDDQNADGNFIAETTTQLVGANANTVITTTPGVNLSSLNIIDGLVITAGRAVPDLPGAFSDETTLGGGAYFVGDLPIIRNCRFSGNHAYEAGGAIYLQNAPAGQIPAEGPIFENCVFTGNRATLQGGAFFIIGGRTVIEACDLESNRAPSGAALFHFGPGGELTLRACRIRAHDDHDANGALDLTANTSTTLINCLVQGNDGDGIGLFGSLTLRGCTFVGNDGRPIDKGGSSSALTVWNSIFWNNTSAYFAQAGGSLAQFHHSLIEGWPDDASGFAFHGNLDGTDPANDPEFFSNFGGGSAPTTLGLYQYTTTSPAMSVGDNDETASTTDLAGNPRLSGHTVDLGCYEYPLADDDHDGLPNLFERIHTSSNSDTALNPASDLDGDGFTALQEFAFDLDPNVPEPTSAAYSTTWNPAVQRLTLYFTPNPDAEHYVRFVAEHSNDLGIDDPWFETAIKPGLSPSERRVDTLTITPRPESQFLRLRIEK